VRDGGECGICHGDPEKPVAVPNPARDIEFSHKDHLARNLNCDDCHQGVSEAIRLTGENMPAMKVCSRCHDDRTAPAECSTCHKDPVGIMKASHPAGWRHDHKYQATQDDDDCGTCHPDTDYCLRCHEGDNLQQTSHPLNYRFTHTLDAKGKEKDCMVCHTNESFCNDCHRREEVMPINHSSASWPARDHGLEAARDLESCAACHDEEDPTCLSCHQDLDDVKGTDPSPHGPGFETERGKGPWHDDPTYLCYRCHRPGPPFRVGGFCRYCHGSSSAGDFGSPVPGGKQNAF
jgi:c(7)-type cytochrome triheme protein